MVEIKVTYAPDFWLPLDMAEMGSHDLYNYTFISEMGRGKCRSASLISIIRSFKNLKSDLLFRIIWAYVKANMNNNIFVLTNLSYFGNVKDHEVDVYY